MRIDQPSFEEVETVSEEEFNFPFDIEEQSNVLAFDFTPENTKELSLNELHEMGISITPPAKISIKDMQTIGAIPEQFELDMEKIQDLSIVRLDDFEFILGIITKDGNVRDIDFSKQEPLNTKQIKDLLLDKPI